MGIRPLTNEEADRLKREEVTRWPSPDRCAVCEGAGTFRWYDLGPDYPEPMSGQPEVVTYECPCIDQWGMHRFLLRCGIGTAYQRLGWRDLTGVEGGAKEAASGYLNLGPAAQRAGIGLLLHGKRGTGKTLLSVLLAKAIVARGTDCHFTTFADLLSRLYDSWRSPDDAAWFQRRFRNVEVLVVDDLGREMKKRVQVSGEGMKDYSSASSEFAIESILRHRLAHARSTIITTNLTVDEMTSVYGKHFFSLLTENAMAYSFQGSDFRTAAASRSADEVRQGLSRPVVIW